MAQEFRLSIVSPERTVFEGEVMGVIAPGTEGYFGIMAHHEPMVAALDVGIIEYSDKLASDNFVSISGGFLEVSEHGVVVLADDAMPAHEIDVETARAQLEEARSKLKGEGDTGVTNPEAVKQLRLAMNRLKAAQGIKS